MTQLPLPITPHDFVGQIMEPALDLLPTRMGSIEARIMLLAIALQESELKYRRQVGGPARGLMQFEQGGGVKGVLSHPASRTYAAQVCAALGVDPSQQAVYAALDQNDTLAVCFGRLLLWTDPSTLPSINDVLGAWNLYQRVWRPGKPRIQDWPDNHKIAASALGTA